MKTKTKNEVVLSQDVFPEDLIIMPILDKPVFPGMVVPHILSDENDLETLDFIKNKKHSYMGLVFLKEPENNLDQNVFTPEEIQGQLYSVGCIGKILKYNTNENNETQIAKKRNKNKCAVGKWRIKI